ncbi:MAG: N-acetylmuramoyl-L-alanine amidase [Chloroflexi bacterium]|nr:N-acetylmuramoyl-L-alanine amidase [Chloroflexota bacterium]
MPIPEDIRVFGRNDILRAVAHRQPSPTIPHPPFPNNDRDVTRTITLHYSHGWCYRGWRAVGNHWFGTVFNLDLDGTLYQCCEMSRRTLHVGGAPYFTGQYSFVNDTSLGIEICRFGKFEAHGNAYRINGYNIPFQIDNADTEECDYSNLPNAHTNTGSCRFNLKKIPGGTTYQQSTNHPDYYLKAATFDDDRNPERPGFPMDVLFTEEQYQTLILWIKAMCEMNRIPKKFFPHPVTGKENPWIDTLVLVRSTEPAAIRNECRERTKAHQGIMGHMNLQGNRIDPGASLDYYRIKRGISDKWWYPVNLNNSERAINYLDQAQSAAYLNMVEYGDLAHLEQYYQLNENANVGFFPIGANRIWHGGIHLPSGSNSKPVYVMANGTIVAARVFYGVVEGPNLPISTCFVLIKHLVHTRDNDEEIDYSLNSTATIYSLYMHLERLVIERGDDGNFIIDYDSLPTWVNHYLIDNPNDTAITDGDIIFPNYPVLLGDKIGSTGDYIVSVRRASDGAQHVQYGKTLHLEVFTTEDISTFPQSPWVDENNRIEDPSADNIVSDLDTIDRFIRDTAGDGIDLIDIKNAVPALRDFAIRNKSEWSVRSREELTQEVIVNGQRRQIGQVVSDTEFQNYIQPLAFHHEMVSRPGANADNIGPFFNNTRVWHLHPFTFMRWMNERVDRHERIMVEQDKTRNPQTSNIRVQESFVVGFQNLGGANPGQLPQRTAANAGNPNIYPEARYSDNTYEVSVDSLADQAALSQAAQDATRFHLHLLEALDIINDRPHGAIVVEGYVSTNNVQCSNNSFHALHRDGRAMDLRPASGTSMADWYNLYSSAIMAKDYMKQAYADVLEVLVTTDPAPAGGAGPTRADLDQNAAELLRRLQNARNPGDAILTQQPAVQHLDMMRLHIGFEPAQDLPTNGSLHNAVWLNMMGNPLVGPLMPGMQVKLRVTIRGIANGSTVNFFIFSRLVINRNPRDIRDSNTLQSIYGNLTFDLDEIERHETRQNCLDDFCQRVQKQVTGVDDSGNAMVTADWVVPRSLPRGAGSFYMVCIVPSGSNLVSGGTTNEHCVSADTTEVHLPKLTETYWSTDPDGANRVTNIPVSQRRVWLIIRTEDLPTGCTATAYFRNQRTGLSMNEETIQLQPGNDQNSIRWQVPGRGNYHCRVRLTKTGTSLEIIGGSGLSVS